MYSPTYQKKTLTVVQILMFRHTLKGIMEELKKVIEGIQIDVRYRSVVQLLPVQGPGVDPQPSQKKIQR